MPQRHRHHPTTTAVEASVQAPHLPLAAGALALVCAVAYWNSFSAGLVLDNVPIILQDPRLRTAGWRSLRDIFTQNYWWPSGDSNLYRPLTTLSYWFNYAGLGGAANPLGYHAINVLLHWLNALLAFVLVRGVTGRPAAALVAAALFACHPLTVESVTNVVGRADLLAALSVLGGLCLYRRFLRAAPPPGRRVLVALAATYAAGLFSKESAVVLPALMLLHDVLFPPIREATRRATLRASFARTWPAYASLLPAAAAFAAARWLVLRESVAFVQFGGDNPIVNAPFLTGVMTAVKVAGYGLGLVVWPASLSCDYSYGAITLFGWSFVRGQDIHAWIALAALLALAATAIRLRHRCSPMAFLLGFAAIAYLPTANLLFPIGTIMAERLMYVSLVGLVSSAVLLAVLAGGRLTSWRPRAARVWSVAGWLAAVAAVAVLSARTIHRNADWATSDRLWSSAAQVVPTSYKVHKALALAAMESDPSGGRVDEAIALAARSIAIIEEAQLPLAQQPAGLYAEAGSYHLRKAQQLTSRGAAGESQAELAQAITLLERARMIDRQVNRLARERQRAAGRRPTEIHDRGSALIYRALATAYLGAGDPTRAIDAAEYLQRISPGHFDPHYMRGVVEAAAAQLEDARGNPREAEAHLARAAINLIAATILNPGHRESWSLLAKVYQYVAPAPPAVVLEGNGGRLNRANPAVARHLQTASSQLLALFEAAGLRDDAAALRGRISAEGWQP